MLNALISQAIAARKINISNTIARFHKRDDRGICQVDAMAQMDVV